MGKTRRIEDDLHRLGVTLRVLLGRAVAIAAGPSHTRRDDPAGVAQQLLHDPGATSRENRPLGAVGHGPLLPEKSARRYSRTTPRSRCIPPPVPIAALFSNHETVAAIAFACLQHSRPGSG